MTLVWTATAKSFSFNRGKFSGTTAYIVKDDAGATITGYDIAQGQTSYQAWGGGTDAIAADYFRFVGYTARPADNASPKVWLVSMDFESTTENGSDITTTDVKTETEIGFSSFEVSIQPNIMEVWTTGGTLPTTNDLKSNPDLTPVGGTPTYTGKDPISFVGHIMNISVRNVRVGRPNYLTIADIVGKRNSVAFTFGANADTNQNMTCAIGTLLFTGANTSRIGPNQYEVNYTFSYDDKFYHLRQSPLMGPEGVVTGPKIANTALSATNPSYALTVYWKQPFPSVTDFSALGLVTT